MSKQRKGPSQILPRLYVGDFCDAEHADHTQFTHILSLHKAAPAVHPLITHNHIPILDEVYLVRSVWIELVHALTSMVRHNGLTLVHCRLGKSRSPALVAAYMAQYGWTPETALAHIKERRSFTDPHPETWRSVLDWYYGKP
jgi:protein-tyrosine phosphatase